MDSQMIEIVNEQGVKQIYEVYFTFECEGVEYIALADIKSNDTLLFKYIPAEDGMFYMEIIEEDLFEKVSEEFMSIMEDR